MTKIGMVVVMNIPVTVAFLLATNNLFVDYDLLHCDAVWSYKLVFSVIQNIVNHLQGHMMPQPRMS